MPSSLIDLGKFIKYQQRLLPVHILQRFCDPNTPFDPLPQFNSEFKRSTNLYFDLTLGHTRSIFRSFSSRLVLVRQQFSRPVYMWIEGSPHSDLAAIRKLDEVSTYEITKIIEQLSQPRHDAGLRPS